MPPLPPNPLGVQVVASSAAGIFVDAVLIGLRLWSRKLKKRKLSTGDYLIVAAWIITFAEVIRKIVAYRWGVGLHIWQVIETDPSHLMDAAKSTWAGFFLWIASVTLIKLSILFVYSELFYVMEWFIRCVRIVMVLCVLHFIGIVVGLAMQCTPVEANWNPSIPGAHCGMDRKTGFRMCAGINIALDILLVVMPMPVIWRLNISRLKKIGVSAMFALGTLILVVVGFRFKMIDKQHADDFLHDGEAPGILISLELYLGMISACLPFLSPPLAKMRTSVLDSDIFRYLSTRTGTISSSTKTSANWSRGNNTLELVGSKQSQEELAQKYADSKKSDEGSVCGYGFVTVPETWPGAHSHELQSEFVRRIDEPKSGVPKLH